MLKKDTLGKASSKSLAEAFRCGDCLHFKQHSHTEKQKLCKDEGIKAFAPAPKCFTPDVTQVAQNTDAFAQVAILMNNFTSKQQRILLGLLRSPKKKQFQLGTKVYFLAMGKDYISNYLAGYAAGYTSSGQLMLLGSPDRNTRGKSFTMYCDSTDHLLLPAQWKFKKRELIAAGKKYDPVPLFGKKIKLTDQDEPPTIDSAPPEWHDKLKKRRKTSKARSNTFKIS